MLNHYIMIKYREKTPKAHVEDFCARMLALRARIPEIKNLEVGVDILRDTRSWDIILIMQFESIDSLRRYQKHPEHLAVMQFNDPYVIDVASLDYEAG